VVDMIYTLVYDSLLCLFTPVSGFDVGEIFVHALIHVEILVALTRWRAGFALGRSLENLIRAYL
jgi:hypothetical protein